LLLAAGVLALSTASLLLPWAPSFDLWGWILWGRQITHPDLIFSTAGFPSWKPLPVAFTALFSLAGSVAPELWLAFARAGALVSLVLAYTLASRHAGRMAGVLAVAGVVLIPKWLTYFAGGSAELLLSALVLGAVERHLALRRGQALALLFAAALLRAEAWPFLLGYGFVYAGRDARRWLALAALFAAVPAAWFLPDWIGAGDPLHGSKLAHSSRQAQDARALDLPLLRVTWAGLGLVVLPLWLGAAVAVQRSLREGERLPVMLAVVALAWMGVVVAMAAVGYAGIPRFMLPAGVLVCVTGAIGVGWVARDLGAARPAVAAALALSAFAPFAIPRAEALGAQARTAETDHELQVQLANLADRLGGLKGVRGCGRVLVRIHFRGALAWKLGVPETSLKGTRPRLFLRTLGRPLPGFPPSRGASSLVDVAAVGPWRAVWKPPRGSRVNGLCRGRGIRRPVSRTG